MSQKKNARQLLDSLLEVPTWYAGIRLAQLHVRHLPALCKEIFKKRDECFCQMLMGRTGSEIPEIVRSFDKTPVALLEAELQRESVRLLDAPFSTLLATYQLFTRYVNDIVDELVTVLRNPQGNHFGQPSKAKQSLIRSTTQPIRPERKRTKNSAMGGD
jgi:hypothetical protein